MSSVLIDNKSMGRVVEWSMNTEKILGGFQDTSIQNYLYALVLWDKIYSIDDGRFSRRWIDKLDDLQDNFFRIEHVYGYGWSMELKDIVDGISQKYIIKNSNEYNEIVKDSIFYILLGCNLGMDVYLSKERSQFVKRLGVFEDIFNRENVINMIEKDVLEFYREINEKVGKKLISFESPLFLDYIKQNCDSLKEAIEFAKYIREEKDIIQFRKAMDDMEKALNSGNFVLFNEYLSVIPDIVSEIKKSGIKTFSTTITISTVPSIDIPMVFESRKRKKKMIHVDFLTDLAMYGMYDRLLR